MDELNRISKVGVVVSTLLILYTLVGFFLIPFTIKKVALSQLPSVLNRPVSLQRVAFNPYTLHLEIEGFEIGKKEGEGNLFSLSLFDINFDSFSLFRLSAIFDQVKIVDPQVDLTVFRGGSSISDLIPVNEVTEKPEETEADKGFFPFIVKNLVITNGTCKLYDKVRDVRHVVSSVDLLVPFTSSLSRYNEREVQPSLNMVINGTPFSLEGHTLPFNQSMKTEFQFSLKEAQLEEYWPYLPIYETTRLKSGTLSTDLALVFGRSSDSVLPHVDIGGTVNIDNFDLAARNGTSFLKFKGLSADLEQLRILKRVVTLSSVKLTDPYLKIGLKEDGSPDLMDYLAPSIEAGEKSKESEAENGPALAALVKKFTP